ncbi:MAG TPA: RidA family protein [Nitrososphaerales archaeon]|nr:RidA family protein [Nitrososphaerales archaeon]
MLKNVVSPENVWDPSKFGFAHGILVADGKKLLFLSGQNGIDKEGKVVAKDFESQCEKAYENIALILESVGGGPSNIVRLTAYVTDVKNSDAFVKISKEFFKGELCSQTLVEVRALAFPELNVELEAIAVL